MFLHKTAFVGVFLFGPLVLKGSRLESKQGFYAFLPFLVTTSI
jgi:hypothetical protein